MSDAILANAPTLRKQSVVFETLAIAQNRKMDAQGLSLIRRRRLSDLLDRQYGGVLQKLADALDVDHAYLWQLMNGRRPITEKTALKFELRLSLPAGHLSSASAMEWPFTVSVAEVSKLSAEQFQTLDGLLQDFVARAGKKNPPKKLAG